MNSDEFLKSVRSAELKAMEMLERRDRSEQEMRKKLAEKEFCPEVIEETVSFLYAHHYLDDLRLAQSFIRIRMESYSQLEIRHKLSLRGVSREVVDRAFEILKEENEGFDGEAEAASAIVRKKLKGRISISYTEKQKIYASLFRKGYSKQSIEKAFEGVSFEKADNEDSGYFADGSI